MTWDQLQQLRSAAQGRIQQRMEKVQPRSGKGAIVSGGSIALQAERRNSNQEEQPWNLAIYATVDYTWDILDGVGDRYSSNGHYEPEQVAYFSHPPYAQKLQYASINLEGTQFFNNASEADGSYSRRSSKIFLEALAFPLDRYEPYEDGRFRVPVEITLGHVVTTLGKSPDVVKKKRLRIGSKGASYSPTPLQMNEFYELRVLEVRRV